MIEGLVLASALAMAQGQCLLKHSVYRLRSDVSVTAAFFTRRPGAGLRATLVLVIRSERTGGAYAFLPYLSSGAGVTTHLASIRELEPPSYSPAPTRGTLGNLDILAADGDYNFDPSFAALGDQPAPAHLLIPGLQAALWRPPPSEQREGVPIAFFDLAGCPADTARNPNP